jgi:hypothetical protein
MQTFFLHPRQHLSVRPWRFSSFLHENLLKARGPRVIVTSQFLNGQKPFDFAPYLSNSVSMTILLLLPHVNFICHRGELNTNIRYSLQI